LLTYKNKLMITSKCNYTHPKLVIYIT